MNAELITILILGILTVYQIVIFGHDLIVNRNQIKDGNFLVTGVIGFFTNFCDSLGIGSYAPTTMLLKLTKSLKNDKLLPGTLNVACALPVMTEAFLYIGNFKVDGTTLLSMVVAAMIGSFAGARIVSRLDEKKIEIIVGIALAVTAVLMILSATGVITKLGANNVATGFHGWKLVVACAVNCILGALMSAGIGLYAPCMALVYLLGMNPIVAFPIMMSSCASTMPIAAAEFIKKNEYARMPSIAITLFGCVGVVIAVTFVKSLNLTVLMWLVIAVMIYTSVLMLIEGSKKFRM
ncbi:sulfite exporter TauE/SafE family protein [Limosilactobacillus oris]|uniref:sulfite exporter TauE/SafE family protein n=1 Tax=Limosilactobacillus oris TaxID=1632 RepID=UPI0018835C67|nr:sulfite exporter TauE/SafE family protein [Limosilactobacillus oris]MBF0600523.1 sulfite exporter TauE/SafE family protein [Limosilactobacillus oris]